MFAVCILASAITLLFVTMAICASRSIRLSSKAFLIAAIFAPASDIAACRASRYETESPAESKAVEWLMASHTATARASSNLALAEVALILACRLSGSSHKLGVSRGVLR
jgi:hypothetical protein